MGSFCCNRFKHSVSNRNLGFSCSISQAGGWLCPSSALEPTIRHRGWARGWETGGMRTSLPFLSHSWNQSQGHTSLQGTSGNEVVHCCVSTKISGGVSITQRKQGRRAVCLCHCLPHRPPWVPHQVMLSYCFPPRARISVCGLLPAPGPLHVVTV